LLRLFSRRGRVVHGARRGAWQVGGHRLPGRHRRLLRPNRVGQRRRQGHRRAAPLYVRPGSDGGAADRHRHRLGSTARRDAAGARRLLLRFLRPVAEERPQVPSAREGSSDGQRLAFSTQPPTSTPQVRRWRGPGITIGQLPGTQPRILLARRRPRGASELISGWVRICRLVPDQSRLWRSVGALCRSRSPVLNSRPVAPEPFLGGH
jgi:hypothetical protein